MKHIQSAQNPTIKQVRKLAAGSSQRAKQGRTILEGVHLCESFLASDGAPELCLVSESFVEHAEVAPLTQKLQAIQAEVIVVPDSVFSSISQLEHGVGVLFVIAIPAAAAVPVLAQNALLLEAVQDPGNLGTMLRTAAAAGITQVFLSAGCAQVWSPKVLRAGMGAHFVLEVYEAVDLQSLITSAQVPVFATSLQAKKTLYEQDLRAQAGWLFGSEGQGVSPELEAACGEKTVIIPQQAGVESLNVAAAAAICLFEQRRQQL